MISIVCVDVLCPENKFLIAIVWNEYRNITTGSGPGDFFVYEIASDTLDNDRAVVAMEGFMRENKLISTNEM